MRIFLHGLDSSGSGTKGSFFSARYPDMMCPDFHGTLQERLVQLHGLVREATDLVVVGSSFGGLMAACLAIDHPAKTRRLILLAPALNLHEYRIPKQPIEVETALVIGSEDVVTPPDIVVPAAEASFSNLSVAIVNDDHLLHDTYQNLDWDYLLR
jgi:pimeloyl-ACP methyl ester carboxylesterase